jgi:hypothetical protein
MRPAPLATIANPLLQRRKEPDEEQLLKLFWNRAELKKELAQLRRDKEKLLDQLRQQENVNLRSQQQLEQLEALLADPVQAMNALVYYQLRGVWQQCRKRLARVGRELSERQHERESQHARGRFEQQRDAEIGAIDRRLGDLEGQARAIAADLQAFEEQHRRLRGFWNYFRRRTATERAEATRAALDGVRTQVERLQAERQAKEADPGPAFAGLSIEGKRNINLAIVAMAQQLLVHFAERNVAGLAREAAVRSLADVGYGSVAECQDLGQAIESVLRRLDSVDRLNVLVRRRAEFLKANAQYRRDVDVVPVAGSFAAVPVGITEVGEPRPADDRVIPVNVLADEYWDVYAALLS